MKKTIQNVALLLVAGLIAGCQTVRPIDDTAPHIGVRLDPTDVRNTVEFMVDSMLMFPPVVEMTANERPVLDLGLLRNNTTQMVDVRLITQNIRTRLIRSGKFRFVDRTQVGEDADFLAQSEMGFVDPDQVVQPGQQSAAQLYLFGDILEMRETSGRTTRQYYQIQLNLRDLRTGEIVWTDIQEIRREQRRRLIGS